MLAEVIEMWKSRQIDATEGAILPLVIRYTIPLILGALIQVLFNAVDIVVLGNMADSTSVASVGATSTIIFLVVNTFIGLAGGAKIILARQIGTRDAAKVECTVHTSLITALGLGVLVMIVGYALTRWFLQVTNCPSECFEGAALYMHIYMLAAPAVLVYNLGAAILNADGDTQRPMYYIVAAGLLNVVMNVVLCLILPQKVAAVAIATLAAQYLGAFLVLRRLCVKDGITRLVFSRMRWHAESFLQIMRFGLPLALNNALFPIANLQIQTAVNAFGVSAVAGGSAATTIEGISNSFYLSFGTTASTFIGQNLGAKQHDRVKRSLWTTLLIGCSVGLVMGVGFYLTGRFWLGFILTDDLVAIEYAIIKMRFITLFAVVSAANHILMQVVQAFGYPMLASLNSIVFVFGFRMIWMLFIYRRHQESFSWLMACFTVSWFLMLFCYSIMILVIYRRYLNGKYKKI